MIITASDRADKNIRDTYTIESVQQKKRYSRNNILIDTVSESHPMKFIL